MNKLLGSLALSLVAPALIGQCISAPTTATSFGNGDDFVANAGAGIDMGFLFPFAGGALQFIHPCSNGYAWLSDGTPTLTIADFTASVVEFDTQDPRIAPYWTDLNLVAANTADLMVDTSVANQCTITWVNAILYGGTEIFSLEMVLDSTGQIQFNYDGNILHTGNLIVGTAPGFGVGTPAASEDLSAGLPIATDMAYEEFPGGTFDLAGQGLTMIATAPGYVPVSLSIGCASKTTYGVGCSEINTGAFELFAIGTQDIGGTGSAITFLRTGNSYTILDAIPGVYVAPTAGVIVASGDDAYGIVTLSTPMPTVGGTTGALTVCTNGFISMSANQPAPGADYSPSAAEFEAFTEPTICGPWYDWSPNVGGQIVAEEIAGIVYVTWEAVTPYNAATTDTFQYQFTLATGDCTIVYDNMSYGGTAAWQTPLFGYTAGSGAGVDALDLSVALPSTVTVADVGAVPLTLDSNAPTLGGNWDITTSNVDPVSPIAITFFGNAQLNVPLTLVFGNADPSCSVYINTILGSVTSPAAGGVAVTSLSIPPNAALVGSVLTAQSICLTATNGSNLLTSNGVEGTLGN
ncbi:MAG: hypothetical protein ACI89X_001131 [Planctomycetota bacterium]|jgi:hypothetical protein